MTGQKLSLGTKLAYGSGDLGTAISAALRAFFMLFFFTDVAGLSPQAAGSIILINKLWDAVNDPAVGWLSDHTVTRWGRRRPWLLWGAIPFGVMFFLLWWVPPLDSTGKYIYYTIVALLLDTFFTVINVPYTALTAELTHDYDERTSLNSYRFAFSVLAGRSSAWCCIRSSWILLTPYNSVTPYPALFGRSSAQFPVLSSLPSHAKTRMRWPPPANPTTFHTSSRFGLPFPTWATDL